MPSLRPAAVAGLFYPEAPTALAAVVGECLRAATTTAAARVAGSASPPKAVIVPHAGYVYSGTTAAAAFARLACARDDIRRVVLFGPAHRVPVRGLALPSASAFATPLGDVRVNRDGAEAARSLPQVCTNDAVHALEHSLEVQLPFLQSVLDDFEIVPFAVGDATAEEVAEVIDTLWAGPETLIAVSSDLSHYRRHADAQAFDRATADAILALSPDLDHAQACGATPINGLMLAARERGLAPELLGLCNSGDTSGDRARVVGYASFAFAGDPT